MLRVRVFKATEDLESCKLFAEGHANVLRDYGITKVTSSRNDWFYNPNVYVVIVENEDRSLVVGGERIHLVHPLYPLPIEDAVSIVEKKIFELVAEQASLGTTGELCGLWNAKSIAGFGVSTFFTKIGIALAQMIPVENLFVLCAPYTVSMCQDSGFEVESGIGDNGTFIYPKLDLIATALRVRDFKNLASAGEATRKEIFEFIEHPKGKTIVQGPRGQTEVIYDIEISRSM